MADLTARDAVLVKYLNEAYGKEKQLETVLDAQIGRTSNMTIKKRLREHLKETKAHARSLQSRIKALGGKETVKLAKQIRREEERMQAFLGRQLATLAGAVIREEVPARERKPAGSRPARRRSTARKTTARKTTAASKPAAASKTTRRRTTTT